MLFQDLYKLNTYRDIYIFSNVPYKEQNKLKLQQGSLAIFLNKASSINYYKDAKKILIRRHNRVLFGNPIPGVPDVVLFSKSKIKSTYKELNPIFDSTVIKKFQDQWYKDPKCNTKGGFTLGLYVAKYIQTVCPKIRIHLVNFGTNLASRYALNKCHDWSWQEQQLKDFDHIYLE